MKVIITHLEIRGITITSDDALTPARKSEPHMPRAKSSKEGALRMLAKRLVAEIAGEMRAEVTEHQEWWEIHGEQGTFYYPCAEFSEKAATGDYPNPTSVAKRSGHGARLTMPGFADCTKWVVFETWADAARYLLDNYGQN